MVDPEFSIYRASRKSPVALPDLPDSMILWDILSKGLRPLPPAPFSSLRLPFAGLGASILAPRGTILAPRDHPGGPWMGAVGRTRGGPEQDVHRFCSDFYNIF